MPSAAAILALDAIGKQDNYLLSNDSPIFTQSFKQHSNFAISHKYTQVNPVTPRPVHWPFGQTVKVSMNPTNMGDLLSNMWIKITLPELRDASELFTTYEDNIGLLLIDKIVFRVDTIEMETVYRDWNVINRDMLASDSDKRALDVMYNVPSGDASGPFDLLIPTNLFFTRNHSDYTTYFPLCAIHKQIISIEIVFNTPSFFTDSLIDAGINSFEIITEEMILSAEERMHLVASDQSRTFKFIERQPQLNIPAEDKDLRSGLTNSNNIAAIFWFARLQKYDDDSVESRPHHLNYSNSTDTSLSVQAENQILKTCELLVDGITLSEPISFSLTPTNSYWSQVQPTSSGLYVPRRNIYCYSFALNANTFDPSGGTNLGELRADRTNIRIVKNDSVVENCILNLYYMVYKTFRFSGGFVYA